MRNLTPRNIQDKNEHQNHVVQGIIFLEINKFFLGHLDTEVAVLLVEVQVPVEINTNPTDYRLRI